MAATHRTTSSSQNINVLLNNANNLNAVQPPQNNSLSLHHTHRFVPYPPLHQPHLAGTHPHHHHPHHPHHASLYKIHPTLGDFYPQQPLTTKSSRSSSSSHQPSTSSANSSQQQQQLKSRYMLANSLAYPAMTPSELVQMENYIRSRRASPPALVAAFNQYHHHQSSYLPHHQPLHHRLTDENALHHHHQTDLSQTEVAEDEEEPMEEQGTHVSHLFPEILMEIFSKLSVRDRGRAAQVCTAWRDAAYAKCVWRGEEATLHLRRATPVIFNSLIRRGIRKVQVLSLRRTLKDVVFGLPQLASLNLSGCYNVTDLNLGHSFSADLPNLKVLDLSLCKQITDTSLSRIAQHLKNLEVLELGGCSNITNTGLLLIAWGLKKLRHLNLRSCWHISDQGIGHLAGLSKETAEGNQQLEYLGLQDCQRLSDESLKHISEGLPSLRSINLSFCVSITDSGLKYLSRMPLLEELNLRACDNVSDIGMSYLAADSSTKEGTPIRALDVSFCDKIGDQALMAISHGLFHLRSLSLSACSITDEGLERISKSLQELQTLNIGQCARVTDAGLKALGENSTQLKAIDLYGCTKITPQGLNQIMVLPKLATLNLGLWHVKA